MQRSPREAGEDSGFRMWQAQVHATSAAHASERIGGWWCGYHAAGLAIRPWARRVVAARALADMCARALVADLRLNCPAIRGRWTRDWGPSRERSESVLAACGVRRCAAGRGGMDN